MSGFRRFKHALDRALHLRGRFCQSGVPVLYNWSIKFPITKAAEGIIILRSICDLISQRVQSAAQGVIHSAQHRIRFSQTRDFFLQRVIALDDSVQYSF